MAHKTFVFPVGEGRTCAVTTAPNGGSGMVLAQLELVNMAGAGSKPAEHSESSVAAAPMALGTRRICLHIGFACKGPLWRLSM